LAALGESPATRNFDVWSDLYMTPLGGGSDAGLGAVEEHITCSLMLLRFVPMRSGSQQCVNVVQGSRPFTAITRVQIPSGTPNTLDNIERCCDTYERGSDLVCRKGPVSFRLPTKEACRKALALRLWVRHTHALRGARAIAPGMGCSRMT
jgi:hypothetical protein